MTMALMAQEGLSLSQGEQSEAWGSEDYSVCLALIDSEMAGPIGQKTWWDDRGHVGKRPREG